MMKQHNKSVQHEKRREIKHLRGTIDWDHAYDYKSSRLGVTHYFIEKRILNCS